MRGRKPTAQKLKLLTGTDRPDRQKNIPRPAPGEIKCPAHLTGKAREAFKHYAEACDWLTPVDADALESYAVQLHVWNEARKLIKRDGILDESKPTLKAHPAVNVMRDSATMMIRLAGELGLTPVSRQRLDIPEPDDDDDWDW